MRFRKLRIAWSVAWGSVAVLLIVLWVRSYTWADRVALTKSFEVVSLSGELVADASNGRLFGGTPRRRWETARNRGHGIDPSAYPYLGFGFLRAGNDLGILIPCWFVVLLAGAAALAPWLPWRFGIRTLLIAMTLLAVVLGLAVWAAGK